MKNREQYLKDIKRIVIKVGSSTLTYKSGLLNLYMIEHLVRQIADIHNMGMEIVFVTSAAIGAGMGKLGLDRKPDSIPESQAAAAVGQGLLMNTYEKFFSEYGKTVAQILITKEDMTQEHRIMNAKNTFSTLLQKGVIPIVNENDAVIVDEIKFGDNDTLSAMVASLIGADLLILLSDVDGLYSGNPRENSEAVLISEVCDITDKIEKCAGGAGSRFGTGGMATKINAARIATSNGVPMVIAKGETKNIIRSIISFDNVGTLFIARDDGL
ncbi:MAG: glutamate 5-kinase [Clostridium sp.]|uniref:glutamate 5-kinase n=1 Tax=Clostridium sp. TaxID=1506 RepID=UPI0025B7DA4D|nr:glutamate 5-kinase [Clostridium sp.]MCH3964377.1 glutamate 5-kinase [Clostridium sp.]MCI1715552.1 glutamate 5-kinase [Clostridium sp.]MCI1799656.1 glutamate 5-kinase [Clostridium sp.]MCI1813736.1 glutamate 5-kinase [Clostridium sp.]MCI1870469.1 glutamate 5-kinase [Clostridium sp.]